MLENYLKITLRNIKKHKTYSAINIAGLAIGIACCMVIFLYVASESSYDRFNKDAVRIYRIAEYRKVPLGEFKFARISPVVATVLKSDFPQVEHAARILQLNDGFVRYENKAFYEERMFYVDQEIFKIFTMPFIQGDSETALENPRTVVMTTNMAKKYFGDENPIGKTIQIKDPIYEFRGFYAPFPAVCDYIVTGVIENSRSNSHFKYDLLLSLKTHEGGFLLREWHSSAAYTYVKIRSNTNVNEFKESISGLAYKYVKKQLDLWGQTRTYFLQPLLDIHYNSNLRYEIEPPGNKLYLYIYSVIGFLILLIGCMNYINLSNVRSVYRTKEVGLRKVVGAKRFQLIKQFLGESIIITILALIFAFLLLEILLPLFNEMAGTELSHRGLFQPTVLLALVGLLLFISIVAGGYPAFILTAFKPSLMIQGSTVTNSRGTFLLKVLVIGQFAISILLTISTITIYNQLHFMKSQSLGFNKEQKLVIPFRMNKKVCDHYTVLKSEFDKYHAIVGTTVSSSVPGRSVLHNSLSFSNDILVKPFDLKYMAVDHDFIPEYGIELVAGRPFLKEQNDEKNAFLINEAAVGLLGWSSPEEAIGKKIYSGFTQKEIVGVTKNFHYQGMQSTVEPLFMEYEPSLFNVITLSLNTKNLNKTLKFIESKWSELHPSIPYEGIFLDEDFDRQYRFEEQVSRLLSIITIMGLFIASLGLFGLALFIAKQRTKEIGIRKVLGASVINIIQWLNRDFVKWILISNIIAWPIAYFAVNRWLQNFAYRIHISWWTFLLAGTLALIIAVITVSYQSIKAALANPVESLRCE
ncbi:MAG: ABC transporter permease [Candidatus Zhuqueibacterota bacterium]